MEHTEKEGYKDEVGYTAWQSGYDAAMYDGMDLSSEMPCKCDACMKAYSEGEETAIKELTASLGLPNTACTGRDAIDEPESKEEWASRQ